MNAIIFNRNPDIKKCTISKTMLDFKMDKTVFKKNKILHSPDKSYIFIFSNDFFKDFPFCLVSVSVERGIIFVLVSIFYVKF